MVYIIAMWVAGITQGLMWRAFDAEGFLVYGNFSETVVRLIPMYWVRLAGGLMYFAGMLLLVVNVWKTIAVGAALPIGNDVLALAKVIGGVLEKVGEIIFHFEGSSCLPPIVGRALPRSLNLEDQNG